MIKMNLKTLEKYIRNLKQLQQTMKQLGLNEASAAASENIQIAEEYLSFMKKIHGITKRELKRNGKKT